MKKKVIIAAVLAICLIGGIAAMLFVNKPNPGKPTHMILNKDQSYGGSLSEKKYGKGAPLNGQYDVENSAYYVVNNDYFNMTSTEERIVFPKFASYQQTMQDSSGLACLVMILNYMGQDVQKQYTELALLKKYEELTGETVYGNGTTEEGLIKLVESLDLGYAVTNKDPAYRAFTKENTAQFFQDAIKDGKFVLVRYESPVGYGWKVVIGYDDLGNIKSNLDGTEYDTFGDDVIIFAEPYDGADHHQDGYATERAQDFFAWWNKKSDTGVISELQSYVIIDPNLDITYDLQPVDETSKQTTYENHLPRNPDGTYGGTRDRDIYGGISSGNGWWDHLESSYYKINDFYNMGSEGSRILLPGYTVLQQTMSSSCGVCAVNSVLTYYGVEDDPYEMEESYTLLYEELNRKLVRGNGSSVTYHKVTLADMGYNSETFGSPTAADPIFPTLESYMEFMRSNLLSGKPVVLSTYLGSGHFLTVIGVDDMGTDYIYDDVIITADSCDYWDGHQDGYNVFSAYKFYRQHTNSKHTSQFSCMIIEKP